MAEQEIPEGDTVDLLDRWEKSDSASKKEYKTPILGDATPLPVENRQRKPMPQASSSSAAP
eukprot:8874595-Pyramimonas_sp.AAC.1